MTSTSLCAAMMMLTGGVIPAVAYGRRANLARRIVSVGMPT